MKYHLVILGCQMNQADAERIAAVLKKLGYRPTDREKEADLILAVACSVRQSAVDRIYGMIHKWRQMKKKRHFLTALTGCVLSLDQRKMERHFDLIFDIKNLSCLAKFLRQKVTLPPDYLSLHSQPTSKFTAFVPIMTGCDNFCSYCVVPYTRGREQSRPEKEIMEEVKRLVKKGYKEIVLLGQNVNSYGNRPGEKSPDNQPFIDLLKSINRLPGKFWLRFISNHPKDMTESLIKIIPKLAKVTPLLHLPLQAGDDRILMKMNRPYTSRQYLAKVAMIRKIIPGIAITTDIIVGFPGETKQEFAKTIIVARKARFDMAYLAQYSQRPGTPAAKLSDDVTPAEKKRREWVLNEVIKEGALANNRKLIETVQEILVDGKKGMYYYGRTNTYKVVKFISPKNMIGKFIKVKIIKAEPWKIEGKTI